VPRKLTRPRRITYRCSEKNYIKFYKLRDKLKVATSELFDKLLKRGKDEL